MQWNIAGAVGCPHQVPPAPAAYSGGGGKRICLFEALAI